MPQVPQSLKMGISVALEDNTNKFYQYYSLKPVDKKTLEHTLLNCTI